MCTVRTASTVSCKLTNEECTASGSQYYGDQVLFCNPVEDTSTKMQLDFVPSNLGDINGVELTGVRDFSMCDACTCSQLVINTDEGTAESDSTGGSLGWAFKEIAQKDGSSLGVFFMRTLKLNGVSIEINGSRPAVLVAQNRMEIGTVLQAGGGYPAKASNVDDFPGPGAGTGIGEGGSYCSAGGLGASQVSEHESVLYGTPENVPLLPGSAGKLSVWDPAASDGGGALQLVAGKSIRFLGWYSGIDAWGGYGDDTSRDQDVSGGGGSGGAILVEAPEVELEGRLQAIGGTGGGGEGIGGAGAGGDTLVGQDGKVKDDVLGGGGGGFGRIRVNTRSGTAKLAKDAYISPSADSGCFTQGKLQARP